MKHKEQYSKEAIGNIDFSIADEIGKSPDDGDDARRLRLEKYEGQRHDRGFDDTELWNLDSTICKFVAPRLREFIKQADGYPVFAGRCESMKEYKKILRKMLYYVEHYDDYGTAALGSKKDLAFHKKMKECGRLWMRYFTSLWT